MDNSKQLQTVLSVCSGYGGIERGLELVGYKHRVLAYVEGEAFALANLVAQMEAGALAPAPIWTDLKTFPAVAPKFRGAVDMLTGGYPCQPFSAAGKRQGTDDPRHLWPYIRDVIEIVRPREVLLENVEGHISLGLPEVLGDLDARGYKTTWGIFSAAEVGAPHHRKRVFILANANGDGGGEEWPLPEGANGPKPERDGAERRTVGYTKSERVQGLWPSGLKEPSVHEEEKVFMCTGQRHGKSMWLSEPNVGRVVDGAPHRVDRLRLLGNGVVPHTAARAYVVLRRQLEEEYGIKVDR